MTALFITIPFSHYCEKARWALDLAGVAYREEGHLPILHRRRNAAIGAKRSVPALRLADGTVLPDSTDIVAWADQRMGARLQSAAPAVAALEDQYDTMLGPHVRRWAYYWLLPRFSELTSRMQGIPRWELTAFRIGRPAAVFAMKRGLNINQASMTRSQAKIEDVFAAASKLLANQPYLEGDTFTAADLTFAALCSPLFLPAELPYSLGPIDWAEPAATAVSAWQQSIVGHHVMRMYRTYRTQRWQTAD